MLAYQMNEKQLSEAFHTDLAVGLSAEEESSDRKSGGLRRLFSGYFQYLKKQAGFADVVFPVCLVIALVFSVLDRRYDLLLTSAISFFMFLVLFIAETAFSFRFKKRYLKSIHSFSEKVEVIRSGKTVQISEKALLPGDLLLVKPGTVLYADARLIRAENLFASEEKVFSSKIPAKKIAESIEARNVAPDQQSNMLWKGSYISSGEGLAVITAVDSDCYVEKTGGRKGIVQRSFFFNKRKSIGQFYSFVYLIVIILGLLISIVFTSNYIEAFLIVGILSSFVLLNPISRLMEWTYYRTADRLLQKGILIKNIEAFDGMNREKDVYFYADSLIKDHLVQNDLIPLEAEKQKSEQYAALFEAEAGKDGISVVNRKTDANGNQFITVMDHGSPVILALGYWERLLPFVSSRDEELIKRIETFEEHAHYVELLLRSEPDQLSYDPDIRALMNSMEPVALRISSVEIDAEYAKIIRQLHRSKMELHLISGYNPSFGAALAKEYKIARLDSSAPETPNYSISSAGAHNLAVYNDALPVEQAHAQIVLSRDASLQKLIYETKCMFCGLRRCMNFLSVIGLFTAISVIPHFFFGTPLKLIVYPLLMVRVLSVLVCYFLIESVRNCNQFRRSIVLAAVTGLLTFILSLAKVPLSFSVLAFSLVLLSTFFFISCLRFKRPRIREIVFLACSMVGVLLFTALAAGGSLLPMLFSVIPTVIAVVLDLLF